MSDQHHRGCGPRDDLASPHALVDISERGFCLLEHSPSRPPTFALSASAKSPQRSARTFINRNDIVGAASTAAARSYMHDEEHVPLLDSQSKQHFSPVLHRHLVCLPSIPLATHALPFALASASKPTGAARARANAHPNTTSHRVMTFLLCIFSISAKDSMLRERSEGKTNYSVWIELRPWISRKAGWVESCAIGPCPSTLRTQSALMQHGLTAPAMVSRRWSGWRGSELVAPPSWSPRGGNTPAKTSASPPKADIREYRC